MHIITKIRPVGVLQSHEVVLKGAFIYTYRMTVMKKAVLDAFK